MFLFAVFFFLLQILSTELNVPVVLGLTTLGLFFASIVFTGLLNETSVQIREKTDPNFRRAFGFS